MLIAIIQNRLEIFSKYFKQHVVKKASRAEYLCAFIFKSSMLYMTLQKKRDDMAL